jgi:hypothetical protein
VKVDGEDKQSAIISAVSSLVFFILLVVDVRLLFPYLQNAESGEFSFENIGNANIPLIIILAAVGVAAFVGARVYIYLRRKRKTES